MSSRQGGLLSVEKGFDPNTGRSRHEIDELNIQLGPDLQQRDRILKRALVEGAAWEQKTAKLLEQWERQNLNPEQLNAVKGLKG